jgi:7-cyano-7-deazaguanine synthase in queuosine biosynthesis
MIVLWSGGLDSSLLLHCAANNLQCGDFDFGKYEDAGKRLLAVAIVHDQVGANAQQECARLNMLKAWHGNTKRTIEYARINVSHDSLATRSNGLVQPQFWLTTVVPMLGDHEDLFIGYIRSDDIWHYRQHVENAFWGMQGLSHKDGKLIMPMEWFSKSEVISGVKHAAHPDLDSHLSCERRLVGLDKLVWYCESPAANHSGVPCGRCGSCETHLMHEHFIKFKADRDELEKKEMPHLRELYAAKELDAVAANDDATSLNGQVGTLLQDATDPAVIIMPTKPVAPQSVTCDAGSHTHAHRVDVSVQNGIASRNGDLAMAGARNN